MLTVQSLFTEYRAPNGASVKAAQDVSFFVPEGKFFTLLGSSGCGKTTTLRSIAGLEKPTSYADRASVKADLELNLKVDPSMGAYQHAASNYINEK